MIDEPTPAPTVLPVPRVYQRHDGWTAECQRAFIEELCRTASVAASARAVNKTPGSAYLLRNRSRKRFSADAISNGDAATRSQLKRLKAQWRKEWEDERKAESSKSSAEIIQSINRKLSTMRDRRRAMMSPRTRRLEALYLQSAKLDQQRGRQYPLPEGDGEDEG